MLPSQAFATQGPVPFLQSLSFVHTLFGSPWQNKLLHVPGVVGQFAFEVQDVPPCWQVPAIVVQKVSEVQVLPAGLLH